MNHVALSLRNIFQKVDGILNACDFPHQILSLFQIDRAIKHLGEHFYLTENVGDQQGKRRFAAPVRNLLIRLSGFKTGGDDLHESSLDDKLADTTLDAAEMLRQLKISIDISER